MRVVKINALWCSACLAMNKVWKKIEDKYNVILNKLHRKRNFFFYELASQCECKMEVIVTFLALLELIKQRSIEIIQSENFENIIIERVEKDGQD